MLVVAATNLLDIGCGCNYYFLAFIKLNIQDFLFNHYSVKSSFGNFQVTSASSLRILVREIEAIAAMKKIKIDDTAIESLKQSRKNTVPRVKNLATDPKGTFESAVAGVGSLFSRAVETLNQSSRFEWRSSLTDAVSLVMKTKSFRHDLNQEGED